MAGRRASHQRARSLGVQLITFWIHYIFRRGLGVHELWDVLFVQRPIRLLYIAGRGFDVRAQTVMRKFLSSLNQPERKVERALLVLVGFSGYELDDSLRQLTAENAETLESIFSKLGETSTVTIASSSNAEDDI